MKHYALIGDPVGHSLSPAIYGFLFEKYGIDADFSLIRLPKGRAGDAVWVWGWTALPVPCPISRI